VVQSSTAAATYKAGMVVGAALGVVLAGLFWGAIASLLPGKHKDKGLRSSVLVLVVAIVAAATVGAFVGLQLTRTKTVEAAPIASPAEGCQAFLDTFDTVAQKNLNNNDARPYFTGLADAARANDPELAADLDTIAAAKDQTSAQTAVQSVLTRCVTNGHVTEETLTAWLDKIQSYGG
jgi:predicted transcriptional regulator